MTHRSTADIRRRARALFRVKDEKPELLTEAQAKALDLPWPTSPEDVLEEMIARLGKVDLLKAELEQVRSRHRKAAEERQAEVADYMAQVARLEKDVAIKTTTIESLRDKSIARAKSQHELEALRAEVARYEQRVQAEEESHDETAQALSEAMARIDMLEGAVEAAREDLAAHKAELTKSRARVEDLSRENRRLRAQEEVKPSLLDVAVGAWMGRKR